MENILKMKFICLLSVCLTRSHALDASTTPEVNNLAQHATALKEHFEGSRNETVELGTSVILRCTDSEIAWKDMIYVIWKIHLRGRNCSVALSKNDPAHDTCIDGKKLISTADGAYNLIIPHFTVQDEGNYTCDVSYQSGGYVENIYISVWTRPDVNGWLETEQGHTAAVCTATSRPAASIHLETLDGKYFTNNTQTAENNEGIYTVTSRFYLQQNVSYNNLTCVFSHLEKTETLQIISLNGMFSGWHIILLVVCAAILIVTVLSIVLYRMREKLKQLRVFRKICCKPSTPTPTDGKNMQLSDPEDVQPYASYVQRVNSIYNSSAELFNA